MKALGVMGRTFRHAENVLPGELDKEVVLLHLDSGRYYSLNEVGARVWRVLGETGELDQAIAELEGVYDVESERLAEDVERLVEDLVALGLLLREG